MVKKNSIKLFGDDKIRAIWDDEQEKWYFSIVDVIAVLTESPNPQTYWRVLKKRLKDEGNETVTNCNALKMRAADGKMRLTDVADTEQLLRIIQSVPSPKAEPFKIWLAKVGADRLDQMQDPELSVQQAMIDYKQLGYSDNWINQRLKSIEIRKDLTDQWKLHNVEEGVQYASLTDIIYQAWAGRTTKEYKQYKGLKKERLSSQRKVWKIIITIRKKKNSNMMEYTDKEYCLEVWGDMACFTRPELKVERVSYDVITPSAARAIFEAIFWKPAIHWQITKIEVLKPIKWTSVRRNEVGAVAGKSVIFIEEKRQQKNTLLLKDVGYRIWAKMEFRSVSKRKAEGDLFSHEPGKDENPMKYYQMFERRASKGQCFNQPYLGTREFSASFRLVNPDDEALTPPISEEQGGTKDLGIMLYDMDFADKKNIQPMFYRPQMKDGVIIVPPINSEEILK